jgi:hypothetical protein
MSASAASGSTRGGACIRRIQVFSTGISRTHEVLSTHSRESLRGWRADAAAEPLELRGTVRSTGVYPGDHCKREAANAGFRVDLGWQGVV